MDDNWDVLDNREIWDDSTRRVIDKRLADIQGYRFFNSEEQKTLEAFCDRLIPQDDRGDGGKIPIGVFIDNDLADGIKKGYRYDNMPWKQDMWRHGLNGLDQAGMIRHGLTFSELSKAEQDEVVKAIAEGSVEGEVWREMSPETFFKEAIKTAVTYYYAHPSAWNEIKFGGPAYPRGYYKLACGQKELFEPPFEE